MKNYASSLNKGQQSPALGHEMVQNNAGGFSFAVSGQDLLERFLLIGSEGGTYYVSEQKLTEESAQTIVNHIKYAGEQVVTTVVDFAINSRAPKADAGIFVLALAATYGSDAVKKQAYDAISKVCRTSTHLFTFLANVKELRGWSRGLRSGVAKFYTSKTAEQVAYQLAKYRNRAGYTHRDALRLSHAKAINSDMNSLFGYAVGKVAFEELKPCMVKHYELAQTASSNDLVQMVSELGLTWEMLPTEKLNEPEILKALLPGMQTIALMRNLNRYTYNGLTEGKGNVTKQIVAKLTDAAAVAKSGVHPINVVNAMMTYASGHGQKGNKTWTPSQPILDAMEEMYTLSLNNVEATGKKILIGVDVSGSMHTPVGGMALSAAQIAHVLALTILKTEKNADLVCFDTAIVPAVIGRRSSLQDAITKAPHGGGTDCAQTLVHALNNAESYDAVIILTDSETWAGPDHGIKVLEQYRRKVNQNVKVVELALTAEGHSNFPDGDKNIMRVVGFDASVTEVISSFLK